MMISASGSAYPKTPLILWHWGSVDAPEWKEFNGDPEKLRSLIVNPERAVVLYPGEAYPLKALKAQKERKERYAHYERGPQGSGEEKG